MEFLHDMVEDFVEVFKDNYSVFGELFELFLLTLTEFLLGVRSPICCLTGRGVNSLLYNEHKISMSGIEVHKAKMDLI